MDRPAKYKVTVTMTMTYELDLEVMATSSAEAQEKADSISRNGCDNGYVVDSSEREFKVTKLD